LSSTRLLIFFGVVCSDASWPCLVLVYGRHDESPWQQCVADPEAICAYHSARGVDRAIAGSGVVSLRPSRGLLPGAGGLLGPGGGLVVAGVGFQAAVEDPDEPVGQLAQRGVVTDPAGALTVVVGAGPWRDP
jgi:hypothetical protein